VSYVVTGIVGVLTYHVARPWRWAYLALSVLLFGVALAVRSNFTSVGHLCALGVGLACYPLVKARPATDWNPGSAVSRLRGRARSAA